jgi:hypothetical protein
MTSQLAGWGLFLFYTHKFSQSTTVHATVWHFGNEGLIKTNFSVKEHGNSFLLILTILKDLHY